MTLHCRRHNKIPGAEASVRRLAWEPGEDMWGQGSQEWPGLRQGLYENMSLEYRLLTRVSFALVKDTDPVFRL